jgi:hypothetical protein
VNPFHNDLLSFVISGPLQRISLGTQASSTGSLSITNPIEAGGYVGLPVLIAAGFFAWRSRHSARMQLSLAVLASSALLSLGPFLYFHGRTTHIPLPFWIIGHLPLVDNLLPVRISFEVSAFVAAMLAFGLDDLRRAPRAKLRFDDKDRSQWRALRAGIATCVVLAVLLVTQLPRWPSGSSVAGQSWWFAAFGPAPVESLPSDLSQMIPGGDPVAITYPYAYGHPSTRPLLWQAQAGYKFRLLGGYAFHPDPKGKSTGLPNALEPDALQTYLASKEVGIFFKDLRLPNMPDNPDLVSTTRITISRYQVRLIIVDRGEVGAADVMVLFRRVLGPPALSAGVFTMWIVPRVSRANAEPSSSGMTRTPKPSSSVPGLNRASRVFPSGRQATPEQTTGQSPQP